MGYSQEVINDSPALYWKLNDASGSPADSSGNSRTGTATSLTYSQPSLLVTDPGTSVSFNGSTSKLTSAYAPFTGNLTLEGWFQRTATVSFGDIFGGTGATTAPVLRMGRTGNSLGPNDIQFSPNSGGVTVFKWTGAVANVNVTGHYAMTWDNTARKAELFVNGVSQGLSTAYSGSFTTPGNFMVGSANAVTLYTGYVAHVAVYTSILSAARIAAHYDAGKRLIFPNTTLQQAVNRANTY